MNDNELTIKKALKKQAEELEKRRLIILEFEYKMNEMEQNILIISAQNKQLEAMLETIQQERIRFLEENTFLEQETKKKKEVVTIAA
jgi:hypothetical protein